MSNINAGFDKLTVQQFRRDFGDAVKELEKKYKVHISLGTLSYNDYEVRGKVIARKGDKPVKEEISSFQLNEIVGIGHKTVPSDNRYKVIKINKKTIKVQNVNNLFNVVKVSPGLLVKV
jgi:hypothetical protein